MKKAIKSVAKAALVSPKGETVSKADKWSQTYKGLRTAALVRRLDGNAVWNGCGVAAKCAIGRAVNALPKGESPKGGKNAWLRFDGQCGRMAWRVVIDKRGIYSRVCGELGVPVVGSVKALEAGGLKVKVTTDEAALVKEDNAVGLDRECVATYKLGK